MSKYSTNQTLRDVGIREGSIGPDAVSILVGPNGSGKSSLMRALAENCKLDTNLIVISNTPYDRFKGFNGVNRLTAGRINQTPSHIIKNEIADSLLDSGAEFYQISSVLKLCGYEPRFGFQLVPDARYLRERGSTYDTLDASNLMASLDQTNLGTKGGADYLDVENAVGFIARHDPKEIIWIDAEASTFEFSRSSEFAHVLRIETLLKKAHVVHKIRVLLTRRGDGKVIELDQASSYDINAFLHDYEKQEKCASDD